MSFAAVHSDAIGTKRTSRDLGYLSAFGAKGHRPAIAYQSRFNEYTPFFCNGPGDVKSPRVIVTPPSSRFCPWSAPRPPHYAVRRNGEPIYMRGSSDDGHWPCNGFTSSTVPATGLRAVGASVRPACVSYSSLINPALRSASLRPTGKLCRQSTCGAGLLRSCEPGRPSPALNLVAWRRPSPNV